MLLRRAWDLIRVARHGTAVRSALVLAAAVVVVGCTETSPGVGPSQDPLASTNPDPAAKCQVVAVAPAAQSVGGLGASGSVTIATTSECTWTATTDVDWITLMPPTHGSGNGIVNFAVAYNNGGTDRTGSMIIAGERSTITQAGFGPLCPFTIEPATQIIGAAGGAGAPIGVSTYGCRWTATSNAPWITVTAGASGVGNGVVAFSVEANTGAARTGTLMIAGRTATISQTAAGAPPPPPPPPTACPSTISPDTQGMDPNGGGGHSVAVTTAGTCAWTATSNDAWITIDTGASGTGNGVVTFSVRRNDTGAGRRGTLTIAGRTATITQGRTGPLPR
jgi:hypothetical protein